MGTMLEIINVLVESTAPNDLKDHRRQMKCRVAELFPWLRGKI